jgi:phosphopantothenoylcysteine decarboxylase/phosphopantothenate--cysteine ligase
VGVTGSIAAYKSALLVRELIKSGADVQVVMTPAATKFITTTTLESLSRHPSL